MTKKELIEYLKNFDDDAEVVVEGFEGFGFDSIDILKAIVIAKNTHSKSSHSGQHELFKNYQGNSTPCNAIYLGVN